MFEVNDTIDATEKKNSIDSSCRDRLSISPYGVACQCEVKSFRFFWKITENCVLLIDHSDRYQQGESRVIPTVCVRIGKHMKIPRIPFQLL